MSEKNISRSELSMGDKKFIEDILKKSPQELSEEDKKVIKARRSYLTSVEVRVFADILEDKKEVVEVEGEKKKPGRRKK